MVLKKESPATTKKKQLIKASAVKVKKEEADKGYCRRCKKTLNLTNFLDATDTVLDKNGKMSVCKICVAEMYARYFQIESDMTRAILRTCRLFNWKYSEEAVTATKIHFETQERLPDDPSAAGIYKQKLIVVSRGGAGTGKFQGGGDVLDLTFYEPSSLVANVRNPLLEDDDNADTLISKWGAGMEYNDYVFLEKKLAEWRKDYSCQNKSELFYMKELSFKELELQNARIEGKSVDSILKSMDNLLKSSALTPAQNTASTAGKSADTWGLLIKMVEQTTPAEYYKDKKIFRDFDKIGAYISNYIKRPILNFIGAGKSFELIDDDDEGIDLADLDSEEIEELEPVGEIEQPVNKE